MAKWVKLMASEYQPLSGIELLEEIDKHLPPLPVKVNSKQFATLILLYFYFFNLRYQIWLPPDFASIDCVSLTLHVHLCVRRPFTSFR